MFTVIEINNSGVVTHGEYDSIEAAEAARVNIRRRASVTGECFAASMFDEEIDANESSIVASVGVFTMTDCFMPFGEAAALLGVRYQQLYQRAVVKAKMSWQARPALWVSGNDVADWKAAREQRGK
jgi:hypothetical protein